MVYKRDNDANTDCTSLKGSVLAKYSELEKLFGIPLDADNYKISGEWVFSDNELNETFTIYDWKHTELYDASLPSVKVFRLSNELIEFHIGGRTSCVNFKNWLEYKLAKLRTT